MLNYTVRVRVTRAIGFFDRKRNVEYSLNFGRGLIAADHGTIEADTYILGITHPVKRFEGRVIAVIRRKNGGLAVVAACKNSRYVNYDIEDAIAFAEPKGSYHLDCLYENSCGAVVFRYINGFPRFLLIKNCRSAHWGFPKGHIERGETQLQTAFREVLEETGIHAEFYEGFSAESDYKIGGKVDKKVQIFLATTKDTQTIIQKEEIEDYIWLDYSRAMKTLKFDNDKQILRKANRYMNETLGILTEPASGEANV